MKLIIKIKTNLVETKAYPKAVSALLIQIKNQLAWIDTK